MEQKGNGWFRNALWMVVGCAAVFLFWPSNKPLFSGPAHYTQPPAQTWQQPGAMDPKTAEAVKLLLDRTDYLLQKLERLEVQVDALQGQDSSRVESREVYEHGMPRLR